jgi:hypothetical protein
LQSEIVIQPRLREAEVGSIRRSRSVDPSRTPDDRHETAKKGRIFRGIV